MSRRTVRINKCIGTTITSSQCHPNLLQWFLQLFQPLFQHLCLKVTISNECFPHLEGFITFLTITLLKMSDVRIFWPYIRSPIQTSWLPSLLSDMEQHVSGGRSDVPTDPPGASLSLHSYLLSLLRIMKTIAERIQGEKGYIRDFAFSYRALCKILKTLQVKRKYI